MKKLIIASIVLCFLCLFGAIWSLSRDEQGRLLLSAALFGVSAFLMGAYNACE